VITGDRVSLRPVELRDHPLIAAWQNHPEVWWWMDYDRPFSLADVADSEARAAKEGHPFVIEVDGRPIGRIGLNAFRARDRICSLYVFIGEPSAWGRGLGRDAVRALVTFAFDRFDLERIELWSLATNERAIRSYRACGFDVDATLPRRSFRGGEWVDRVVMSVTREAIERRETRR
jgi:RimJ/RimL family protein N-acetyltransferase